MIFGIHCNTFCQHTSSFSKFWVKQAVRKFSGIHFSCTYRLVLVIRTYSDKKWFIQKYKQQESWSNKNHPHKYVQHQVLYQIQQQIYKILLFIFLFTYFQTKTWSYNWLKIIADNWVIISCGWISLSKTSVCLEYDLLHKRKRLIYWY